MGSVLASAISNNFLQKIFAIFLLIIGINQAIQTIKKIRKKKNDNKDQIVLKVYIK